MRIAAAHQDRYCDNPLSAKVKRIDATPYRDMLRDLDKGEFASARAQRSRWFKLLNRQQTA